MSILGWTVVLVGLFIVFTFIKRIPLPYVMFVLPLIVALLAGFPIKDVVGMFTKQWQQTMASGGIMLLYAMVFFNIMTESGFFTSVAYKVFRLTKGKMNVYVVFAMTFILMTIGKFTGSVAAAMFLTFPLMIPFYDRMNVRRIDAFTLCCLANALTSGLPWSTAVAQQSMIIGEPVEVVAQYTTKFLLLYIPAAVLEIIFFAWRHKKNGNPMSVELSMEEIDELTSKNDEGPLKRPKFFAVNAILVVAVLVLVFMNKIAPYVIFAFATLLAIVINYPDGKDLQAVYRKTAPNVLNGLILFAGVAMYIAVMNGTGMTESMTQFLSEHLPAGAGRVIPLLVLFVAVPFVRLLPYQILTSLYPIIGGLAVGSGLTMVQAIGPFITHLGLGTMASPLTATTLVGCGLLEIDATEYSNTAVPVQTVASAIVILLAFIFGLI